MTNKQGSILISEDEVDINNLLSLILQTEDFTVFQAFDGQAALDLFTAHQDEIELIVTDLGLPKLGGVELIEARGDVGGLMLGHEFRHGGRVEFAARHAKLIGELVGRGEDIVRNRDGGFHTSIRPRYDPHRKRSSSGVLRSAAFSSHPAPLSR